MNGRTGRMVFVTMAYILIGPIFVLFVLGYCVCLCFESKREFGEFCCKEVFKRVGFDALRCIHKYYKTYVNYGADAATNYLVNTLKDEDE